MALATWWRSDTLPSLPVIPGFHAAVSDDDVMLARLNRIPLVEVRARRRDGHRPYVGRLHGIPVTYGWVATRSASIGELNLTIRLSQIHRYLWDFATLPAWQGRGLYPRLLQAILRQEVEAERFWIIYAPENLPSGAGMRKAGFLAATELSFDADHQVRLATLGAPLVEHQLAPCWCCQNGETTDRTSPACWPPSGFEATACTCAIAAKPSAHLAA
jgi:hypothetical protein